MELASYSPLINAPYLPNSVAPKYAHTTGDASYRPDLWFDPGCPDLILASVLEHDAMVYVN
jgi:hypothetical protein